MEWALPAGINPNANREPDVIISGTSQPEIKIMFAY